MADNIEPEPQEEEVESSDPLTASAPSTFSSLDPVLGAPVHTFGSSEEESLEHELMALNLYKDLLEIVDDIVITRTYSALPAF